jgi:hypothetical protein
MKLTRHQKHLLEILKQRKDPQAAYLFWHEATWYNVRRDSDVMTEDEVIAQQKLRKLIHWATGKRDTALQRMAIQALVFKHYTPLTWREIMPLICTCGNNTHTACKDNLQRRVRLLKNKMKQCNFSLP